MMMTLSLVTDLSKIEIDETKEYK